MAVQLPTPQQIRELADEMGLDLTDADVESYMGLLQGMSMHTMWLMRCLIIFRL